MSSLMSTPNPTKNLRQSSWIKILFFFRDFSEREEREIEREREREIEGGEREREREREREGGER